MCSFSGLSLTFQAMVMLVLLVCANASGGGNSKNNNNNKFNGFDVNDLSVIQWACEPFLDASGEQNHPFKDKTRELCTKLRGGQLEEGVDSDTIAAEITNSSIEEIGNPLKEKGTETDSTEGDDSSPATSITENAEINSAATIEIDVSEESTSNEQQHVPSAAPTTSSTKNYTFSLLQKNDGHETDPDGIPSRYLKMQGQRRDLAKAAMEKTIEWRKENDIDTILARPHPKFDVSKAVFPHYFCGLDDTQHVILLQRPGLMNVKLAQKNNLAGEDLLLHYIYVMEYLWRILDPASDATMTSIIDLTEMNISILRKREQLRIGSLFLSTMDAHFPQRSHRTYLINAPRWFGALYKIASPLLRESTKEKISILSKGKEQDEVLRHLLQDCPIPEGEKVENVPAGIMEEDLRNFCLARLEENGLTMQPVDPL